MAKEEDIIEEALELFEESEDCSAINRNDALSDIDFARLSNQWPDKIKADRSAEGRPCLVINRLPSFIKQVVNDARQNNPAIQVHPVDSAADPPWLMMARLKMPLRTASASSRSPRTLPTH
jgi:hypothetical protein